MSYKYKKTIKNNLEYAAGELMDDYIWDYKQELDEVYRKAQAWDELKPIINDAIQSVERTLSENEFRLGGVAAYKTIIEHVDKRNSDSQ